MITNRKKSLEKFNRYDESITINWKASVFYEFIRKGYKFIITNKRGLKMKKFKNQNVLKEIKNINKIIIIGIIILLFGIALGLWGGYEIDQASENAKSFSKLLLSDEEKENQIAKLDVTHVPYQFAVQDGNNNSYYIVMDEDYMYVAYMTTSTFNSLNREDITENPGKIEGMTKLATREIKELAVEAYNDAIEDENYKITVADYDNYFGSVYLDASEDALSDVGSLQMTGCMICLIIGLASLLTGIIKKVHFNISVKKMDEDLIEKLDNEMNDTDAFYYEKTHLYLTKNSIINFQGRFKVIEYRDVIWMYAMNYRTNGIKTSQSINIMDVKGKVTSIATINIVTKEKKEIYDEIWNTIASKNTNILLGYTKENAETAKTMKEN